MEGGSFILCLDDDLPNFQNDKLTSTALNSLHGMGSKINGKNRWYDKALQFIVAKSGEVAICNEHSFAEAVPTMNIADHVIDRLIATQDHAESSNLKGIDLKSLPTLVNFQTDKDKIISIIQESTSNLDT